MLNEVAIGAVVHTGVLTIAVRQGNQLKEPVQHKLDPALNDAVVHLLAEKYRYRHDDPVVYLESGSAEGALLEKLQAADKREGINSRDQIIEGLGHPASVSDGGVSFYDRRSELHYRLRQRVECGELLVPAAYNEQISAFDEQVKDGKIFFPYVAAVAEKLGRYPALAVAAVLAVIEAPRRGSVRRDHNPYELMERG
jgi:hypothetical protein